MTAPYALHYRDDPDSPGACRVDFDDTVTFSVSVTLENCSTAQRFRCLIDMLILGYNIITIFVLILHVLKNCYDSTVE